MRQILSVASDHFFGQPSQPLYTLCGDTAEPDLPGAVTLSRYWIYFSGEKPVGMRKLLS
jgi:hypothetical protein